MNLILKLFAWAFAVLYFISFFLVSISFVFVSSFLILEALERDSVMKVRVDDDESLSFDEAADIARRFDAMADKIDSAGWSPKAGTKNINDLVFEVTPMFMYEGLVTDTGQNFEALPFPFADGFEHNHISGRSDCETYVLLNARYQNEASSWFQKSAWPAVLVHEIAHVQQGLACSREYNSQDLLENSAQIMSWEVMAAIGNQGSEVAILSLVYELRSVAISSAAAMAVEEDRQDDYEKLIWGINGDDPHKMAAMLKGRRFWATDIDMLNTIRLRYSWTPLDMVFRARHEGTIYQLALSNDTHSAVVDDLLYFIEHAEGLVDWALESEQQAGRAGN